MSSVGPGEQAVAPGPARAGTSPAKGKGLSAAATRGYSVAQHWERLAVLTESQQAALDQISEHCSERAVPQHIADQATDTGPTDGSSGAAANGGRASEDFENAVLHNSAQFYRWHSELEATRTSETEEKFRTHARALQGHLTACQELQAKVDETLEFFGTLKLQHHEVAAKTRQLHDGCQQLVAEKDALADFAGALRRKLAFFDELEAVGSRFHGSSAPSVDSEAFLTLLARLDDSLAFVAAHPQYADAAAYAGKFRALQQRALSAVRAGPARNPRRARQQWCSALLRRQRRGRQ